MSRKGFKLNWKYAIGEILLIFIGISLAIGFQNWNEGRKDQRKVNGHLSTIADNVAADSIEISKFILVSNQKRKASEAYIDAVRAKKPSLEALMGGLLQLEEEYLNINTNGFEGLKASGYLSDIQADEIEKALFDYYVYFDEVHEEEISINTSIEAQELEFVKSTASPEFMIMITDIYLGEREATLTKQEQRMVEEIFDHPSLISINLRASYIYSRYHVLRLKGAQLRKLIKERLNQ